MSEQVFKSPGFFEKEVDLSQRTGEVTGVPAGVAGTAEIGPAFVPVTIGSMVDFKNKFGDIKAENFGPYAVKEFLRNRSAITYVRVLGAGANTTSTHINNTAAQGIVNSAGFIISGSGHVATDSSLKRAQGDVVFLCGLHTVPTDFEVAGYPIFTDNRTFGLSTGGDVHLVRGMLFTTSGSRIEVLNHNENYPAAPTTDDQAVISDYDGSDLAGTFKLVVSCSQAGTDFANDEGKAGIKIYTASLDPSSIHYVGKVLNKDPDRFFEKQHLLYAEFPVESEIAKVKKDGTNQTIAILSGSEKKSASSGDSNQMFEKAFGRFDTRYTAARTTDFISQPFGNKEFDLFHFETISDGASANVKFKASISNIKKSSDPKNPYGSFTVEIRDFGDNDRNLRILERYPNCNLNPADENYIAKKIGDMKVFYNFDAETDSERRLIVEGKNPNKSQYIRVIMNSLFDSPGAIPSEALPFGFRGLPVLKTTDTLTDNKDFALPAGQDGAPDRLHHKATHDVLSASVLPPVPFRFKVTKGAVKQASAPPFTGAPGSTEVADANLYWGIKFEKLPTTASMSNSVLNSNASSEKNPIIENFSKFLGIRKLDTLVTGSGADQFNDNKFTLARVALRHVLLAGGNIDTTMSTALSGTASESILETAYLRDKDPDTNDYTLTDGSYRRASFATLLAANSHVYFNKFTNFAKFTNMFYGGFDGNNLLDKDMRLMNDRASSSESGGKANGLNINNLHSSYTPGIGPNNNTVFAYRTAAKILSDNMSSRINILTIPGIRDSFVTDHAQDLTREYGQAIYLMDIPSYDKDNVRRYDGSDAAVSVNRTIEQFEGRQIDNNFTATYFPDVQIEDDDNNNRVVGVPASVVALGAIGFNDSIAYPWFAPAGFNRGALEIVRNTDVRLTAGDRDNLYEARINPIANFPNGGFVIFGQKTLQQDKTALDRVNVRRMLLEVKRLIVDVANKLVFEQNTPATRARFVSQVTPLLAVVQSQQGIDQFKVVMDSSNNTDIDIENNVLNGRIVLVPTRAVEFIAVDFIITNSGVSFA